jgi:hypothetical protein
MSTMIPASKNASFARILFFVLGSGVFALAGCSADAAPDASSDATETEATTGTTAEALRAGGGGGLGFTCLNGVCTCSKAIEGDCGRMRINCVGDLTGLDNCLKGWLTTDCSCATRMTVKRPPIVTVPPGGGVLAP